jgi:hypothetical protein
MALAGSRECTGWLQAKDRRLPPHVHAADGNATAACAPVDARSDAHHLAATGTEHALRQPGRAGPRRVQAPRSAACVPPDVPASGKAAAPRVGTKMETGIGGASDGPVTFAASQVAAPEMRYARSVMYKNIEPQLVCIYPVQPASTQRCSYAVSLSYVTRVADDKAHHDLVRCAVACLP